MAITRAGKICSFCGTPGGPGTDLPLVGGLGAQVCVRCVEEFHAVLHDDEQLAAIKGASPWDRMTDAEVLAMLPQILASAEQNISFAHEWVDLLRERHAVSYTHLTLPTILRV